jgi:hypothetical protein
MRKDRLVSTGITIALITELSSNGKPSSANAIDLQRQLNFDDSKQTTIIYQPENLESPEKETNAELFPAITQVIGSASKLGVKDRVSEYFTNPNGEVRKIIDATDERNAFVKRVGAACNFASQSYNKQFLIALYLAQDDKDQAVMGGLCLAVNNKNQTEQAVLLGEQVYNGDKIFLMEVVDLQKVLAKKDIRMQPFVSKDGKWSYAYILQDLDDPNQKSLIGNPFSDQGNNLPLRPAPTPEFGVQQVAIGSADTSGIELVDFKAAAVSKDEFLARYNWSKGDEVKLVRKGNKPNNVKDNWSLSITRNGITFDSIKIIENKLFQVVMPLGVFNKYALDGGRYYGYRGTGIYLGRGIVGRVVADQVIQFVDVIVAIPSKDAKETKIVRLSVPLVDGYRIGISTNGGGFAFMTTTKEMYDLLGQVHIGYQPTFFPVPKMPVSVLKMDAEKYSSFCQKFAPTCEENMFLNLNYNFTSGEDLYNWQMTGKEKNFVIDDDGSVIALCGGIYFYPNLGG